MTVLSEEFKKFLVFLVDKLCLWAYTRVMENDVGLNRWGKRVRAVHKKLKRVGHNEILQN